MVGPTNVMPRFFKSFDMASDMSVCAGTSFRDFHLFIFGLPSRITSYNVCYTKLLRVVFYIDPEMASDPQLDDLKSVTLSYTFYRAESEELDRITSYNVCYTKLLRDELVRGLRS